MGKLRLNLDQLSVDSFDTAAPAAKKGTVFGEQECTCPTACQTACTCPGCPSCGHSDCGQDTCPQTCLVSCGGSCWYTECPSNPTCNPSGDPAWPCCPY